MLHTRPTCYFTSWFWYLVILSIHFPLSGRNIPLGSLLSDTLSETQQVTVFCFRLPALTRQMWKQKVLKRMSISGPWIPFAVEWRRKYKIPLFTFQCVLRSWGIAPWTFNFGSGWRWVATFLLWLAYPRRNTSRNWRGDPRDDLDAIWKKNLSLWGSETHSPGCNEIRRTGLTGRQSPPAASCTWIRVASSGGWR